MHVSAHHAFPLSTVDRQIMNALALAGVAKWPVIADPILVGVICSYLAVSAVSRGGSVSKAESDYRIALHAMPPQERNAKVVRQTLVWPKVMVAMGFLIDITNKDFVHPKGFGWG